ncbi:hypothetical protein [Streptomyces sp. NPDC005209]|uniref:hypothetical protein n=1 Tax=Streptomyces sp. NPDC005209 TaxID=3156715 RepID=UPI0033B25405
MPVSAKRPGAGFRWTIGWVWANAGEFAWEPRWPWARLRELPADLRPVRTRQAQGFESWVIPYDAVVIECESGEGPTWLAVLPIQVDRTLAMINRG